MRLASDTTLLHMHFNSIQHQRLLRSHYTKFIIMRGGMALYDCEVL